jgi:hypothetical protein
MNQHEVHTVSASGNRAQVVVKAPAVKAARTYHIAQDPHKPSIWRGNGATFEQRGDRFELR